MNNGNKEETRFNSLLDSFNRRNKKISKEILEIVFPSKFLDQK